MAPRTSTAIGSSSLYALWRDCVCKCSSTGSGEASCRHHWRCQAGRQNPWWGMGQSRLEKKYERFERAPIQVLWRSSTGFHQRFDRNQNLWCQHDWWTWTWSRGSHENVFLSAEVSEEAVYDIWSSKGTKMRWSSNDSKVPFWITFKQIRRLPAAWMPIVDAKKRLMDKAKGRGFWAPSKSNKGKGKGNFKGGFKSQLRKPLARRILESTYRICNHWKAVCPQIQSQLQSCCIHLWRSLSICRSFSCNWCRSDRLRWWTDDRSARECCGFHPGRGPKQKATPLLATRYVLLSIAGIRIKLNPTWWKYVLTWSIVCVQLPGPTRWAFQHMAAHQRDLTPGSNKAWGHPWGFVFRFTWIVRDCGLKCQHVSHRPRAVFRVVSITPCRHPWTFERSPLRREFPIWKQQHGHWQENSFLSDRSLLDESDRSAIQHAISDSQ